jgi:hypothetical protein
MASDIPVKNPCQSSEPFLKLKCPQPDRRRRAEKINCGNVAGTPFVRDEYLV